MKTSTFALIFGLAYAVAGLMGLVPLFLTPPPPDAPPTTFTILYGYLFGLFPVNLIHTLLNLAIGVWGLAAWAGRRSAITYARSLAVFFGALAIMGMLPLLNTLFGMMPIHSGDVWLHAFSAVIAAYFGWYHQAEAAERRRFSYDRRQKMMPVAKERRFGLADRREQFGGMSPA